MAYIDEWKAPIQIRHQYQEKMLRDDIARHFWYWYDQHQDDVLVRIKILFWSEEVTVSDLKSLFIMLFGSP